MDRLGQWSNEETTELLSSRFELDQLFMETKRNKHLWAAVSSRMQRKGLPRTPDQCKCKWKNLVTRYKAAEGGKEGQFAFYEEMRRIFSAREESPGETVGKRREGGGTVETVEAALEELMGWQEEGEEARVRAAEERERERREKEVECRMVMESVVVEKAVFEQGMRQREEERWAREERRAQRWDALFSALFDKLVGGKSS